MILVGVRCVFRCLVVLTGLAVVVIWNEWTIFRLFLIFSVTIEWSRRYIAPRLMRPIVSIGIIQWFWRFMPVVDVWIVVAKEFLATRFWFRIMYGTKRADLVCRTRYCRSFWAKIQITERLSCRNEFVFGHWAIGIVYIDCVWTIARRVHSELTTRRICCAASFGRTIRMLLGRRRIIQLFR